MFFFFKFFGASDLNFYFIEKNILLLLPTTRSNLQIQKPNTQEHKDFSFPFLFYLIPLSTEQTPL